MTVVRVKALGKGYRQYRKPSDGVLEILFRKPRHSMLWALRGVSFDLAQGETLGVIGDNGAGKSTLLKLLAGTIKPTEGRCRIDGRVSAILELGSGFHPEFTGRENIRIGCALLGLGPKEIEQRMPGIVAFSELGEAVDRPVKSYSSGMYVRLAFAVVTSVDPDILVIDEALSVGDQHFQKKSLDRIRQFVHRGKTLVFCSHNLYQVKSLCRQVIWLNGGQVAAHGTATDVIARYEDHIRGLNAAAREPASELDSQTDADKATRRDPVAWIEKAALSGGDGHGGFVPGDDWVLDIAVQSPRLAADDLNLGVVLVRNDEIHVYGSSTEIDGITLKTKGAGEYGIRYRLPDLQLFSGSFVTYIYLTDPSGIHIYDMREAILSFTVVHDTMERGVARLEHYWE